RSGNAPCPHGGRGCGGPPFFRRRRRSGMRPLAMAVRGIAVRSTVAAIPAAAAASPAPATFGALAFMRCRRAGLLARYRWKIRIDGTRLALLPLLSALTMLLLAATVALAFTALAALALARLIAVSPRLLLLRTLRRTLPLL